MPLGAHQPLFIGLGLVLPADLIQKLVSGAHAFVEGSKFGALLNFLH